MKKEYQIALGWKIFILVLSPAMMGLFGWVSYSTLTADPINWTSTLILIPVSVGMILVFVYGIFDMFISKLIVLEDRIVKINPLGKKELRIKDIKGISSDQNYVYVHPKNESIKTIKVSQYYGQKTEWLALLNSGFRNLDVDDYVKEVEELYENETFGRTQDERDEKIAKTKRLTKTLNYVSWGIAGWLWLYPKPYDLVTALNIFLPLFGLFLLIRSRGLIKIVNTDNSPYPSLSTTLSIPPAAVMLRVLLDFNILEYQNAWIYTFFLSPIILFIIIKSSNSEFNVKSKLERLIIYPFLIITISVFIFFGSLSINCTYDESEPTKIESTVLEKRISESRRSTRYLLTISPWGEIKERTEVTITKRQYESIEKDDKIFVYQNHGLIGIPWFYVSRN